LPPRPGCRRRNTRVRARPRTYGETPHGRSRIQGWHNGVAELLDLQTGYAAWLDTLPESLQSTATAEALQAIIDLDLDGLAAIEPPRGYGRD
jgi:hypothetical protein